MTIITPKTSPTGIDKIILAVVLTCFLLLIGYNLGLSVGMERVIPPHSTPIDGDIGDYPVRFVVTARDTLTNGMVVEVIEDMIWHSVTLTMKYSGKEVVSIAIDR